MSAIERGLYVTVGAADLAAEKVRELPPVKVVVERAQKLRETSIIDQAREIEPKVRKQAKELQARGEKVVKQLRKDAKDFQKQLREFPTEARKQLKEFPENARKQVETFRTDARKQVSDIRSDIRGRINKAVGREVEEAKPAAKTSAQKSERTSQTAKVS